MEENFKNNADVSEDEESKIQIENLHDTCRICLTVARNMKSLRNSGWHEIQDCANIKVIYKFIITPLSPQIFNFSKETRVMISVKKRRWIAHKIMSSVPRHVDGVP